MTKSDNKTIQERIAQLETLVAWFDSDEFSLEVALEKFKEAEALAKSIEKELSTLKNEIEIVKQKFDQP
jgi:exodeoxyribonuclease VII small subunit